MFLKYVLPGVCAGPSPISSINPSLSSTGVISGCASIAFILVANINVSFVNV